MKVTILISTVKESLLSVVRIFGFGKETAKFGDATLRSMAANPKLNRAMLTVRMALNPGEKLNAASAARIKQEAKDFEDFCRTPRKIQSIVLNVKDFYDDRSYKCVSREQYQINHPFAGSTDSDGGHASAWYKVAQSPNKVLEYVAKFENGRELTLLRTYTNWPTSRALVLGMNQTFYLNLVEVEPGYVHVRAAFTPASAVSEVVDLASRNKAVRSASAGFIGSIGSLVKQCGAAAMHFPERTFALPLSGLIMAALLSGVWLVQRAHSAGPTTDSTTEQTQLQALVGLPGAEGLSTKTPDNGVNAITPTAPTGKPASDTLAILQRMAVITSFKTSITPKSCTTGPCLKMLNGIKRKLRSSLDDLKLPLPSTKAVAPNREVAIVDVSYEPIDSEKGKLHLTLSDEHGNLWNTDRYFAHAVADDPAIDTFTEQFYAEVLLQVLNAKNQCLSETERVSSDKDTTK